MKIKQIKNTSVLVQIESLKQLTVCCRVETKNKIFHRREKLPTILNQRARRGLGRFSQNTQIFYIFFYNIFIFSSLGRTAVVVAAPSQSWKKGLWAWSNTYFTVKKYNFFFQVKSVQTALNRYRKLQEWWIKPYLRGMIMTSSIIVKGNPRPTYNS